MDPFDQMETRPPGLEDYVSVLRNHVWAVAITVLLCLGLAVAYIATRPPSYVSTAEVLVTPSTPTELPDLATETEVARSAAVANIALERLRPLGMSTLDLLERISVTSPQEASILQFSFHSEDPNVARKGAQAFADAYLKYRETQLEQAVGTQLAPLETQLRDLTRELRRQNRALSTVPEGTAEYLQAQSERETTIAQISDVKGRISEIDQAIEPGEILQRAGLAEPAATPAVVLLIAAVLIGLLLGVIVAFVRDGLSTKIKDTGDVEHDLGTPVLGVIPLVRDDVPEGPGKSLITVDEPASPAAQSYRLLRTGVRHRAGDEIRVIMVTSSNPGEGKTTTSANLAVALAQADLSVILVEGDVHRPDLYLYFMEENQPGLAHALSTGEAPQIAKTSIENLRVIPSGPVVEGAAHLFETETFTDLIGQLREEAEFIIIDAPPLAISDPVMMAQAVDGTLFVVDPKETRRQQLRRVREVLGRVGTPLMGAVLNKDRGAHGTYRRYYQYYAAAEGRGAKKVRRLGSRKPAEPSPRPVPVEATETPTKLKPEADRSAAADGKG